MSHIKDKLEKELDFIRISRAEKNRPIAQNNHKSSKMFKDTSGSQLNNLGLNSKASSPKELKFDPSGFNLHMIHNEEETVVAFKPKTIKEWTDKNNTLSEATETSNHSSLMKNAHEGSGKKFKQERKRSKRNSSDQKMMPTIQNNGGFS